jgi:hypothetical protein
MACNFLHCPAHVVDLIPETILAFHEDKNVLQASNFRATGVGAPVRVVEVIHAKALQRRSAPKVGQTGSVDNEVHSRTGLFLVSDGHKLFIVELGRPVRRHLTVVVGCLLRTETLSALGEG